MIARASITPIMERQEKLIGELQEATSTAVADGSTEDANALAAAATTAIDGFRSLAEVPVV